MAHRVFEWVNSLINSSGNMHVSAFNGFSVSNLRLIRQFYLTYQNRAPAIRQSVIS